jgi:hypothetical protein
VGLIDIYLETFIWHFVSFLIFNQLFTTAVFSRHLVLIVIQAEMTSELFRNSTYTAQFFVLIIFSPLGIAVTWLRFVATRREGRKIGLEDWFAVLATIFFLLTNIGGLGGK